LRLSPLRKRRRARECINSINCSLDIKYNIDIITSLSTASCRYAKLNVIQRQAQKANTFLKHKYALSYDSAKKMDGSQRSHGDQ
jgi:hypothetical protein